jgi:hypothetical protein
MKKFFTFLSILIISLTVYVSFNDLIPSSEKPLDKYDFSIENALDHLRIISKKPHYTGSEYHSVVRDYILNELKNMGLETEIQNQVVTRFCCVGTNTSNIIGTIKGSSNGKSLVLLTHYDSRHHASFGASDAGSGVVTILEGVRSFLSKNTIPINDIHLVFTDAEEIGLLGAQAFVKNHSLVDNIGLVLNFEARGSGGPSYMLMETNGKNGVLISEFINAEPGFPAANSLMYSIYKMLPNDTDLTVFREQANINGFNFAFIGDHFDYHTSLDSFERLDRNTLIHQADYIMSMLNHFSKINLSNLDSENDYVYLNFPILKMLHYPYSWIYPLLIFSIIFFLFIIYLGLAINKLSIQGILNGILALTISLFTCLSITIILWKTISYFNPDYADILHGFTYNGYYYITAFIFLNIFCLFSIYYRFFKNSSGLDLTIIPIGFWLIINVLISIYLKGAAYFIIPVNLVLFSILLIYFSNFKGNKKMLLWTFFSVPLIYIFAPQLKMFPVGLGLDNLFITSFFLVLIFVLLLPVFSNFAFKNQIKNLTLLIAIVFFALAFLNNDYDVNSKKPNSILYYSDLDSKQSYWLSRNENLDEFTSQFFKKNESIQEASFFSSSSKYGTPHKQSALADFIKFSSSDIQILKDTIVENKRNLQLKISPERKINKIDLTTDDPFVLNSMSVQGVEFEIEKSEFKINPGQFLTYYLSYEDKDVTIELDFEENLSPSLNLIETSFDLFESEKFNFKPREDYMMPMPFVNTDAIVLSKKIKL